MNDLISPNLQRKIDHYRSKGGKRHRRVSAQRIENFIEWCGIPGEQIGRKHVLDFFDDKRYSSTTNRDYFYAISKLWQMLGRSKEPPRPKNHNSPG